LKLETADYLIEMGLDSTEVRRTVQQALDLARSNLSEARRSINDLRAVPLDGRGLVEALADFCRSVSQLEGIQVAFEIQGKGKTIPGRMETGLYRIVQEAILNVRRHSNARHASVRLTIEPKQVILVIEDDGSGFDPSLIAQGHFGLLGLRERAKLMGGSLELKTEVGRGTLVEVFVPIQI